MQGKSQLHAPTFVTTWSPQNVPITMLLLLLSIIFLFLLLIFAAPKACAQIYQPLVYFNGGDAGGHPASTLVMDKAGNLYGSTRCGGSRQGWCDPYGGCGAVYRVRRTNQGWHLEGLYMFNARDGGFGNGGEDTSTQVVVGPDSTPYGTTMYGGDMISVWGVGYGTVFNLKPPSSSLGHWRENVIHTFQKVPWEDGWFPNVYDRLVFDPQGVIFGTTITGTVYQLVHSEHGWTETILYRFVNQCSLSGVVLDNAGNLYGTTECGGYGAGLVFQLIPSQNGWTKRDVYVFTGREGGIRPRTGVIFDSVGNLYGTTESSVYMLTPSNREWNFTLLHTFDSSEVTRAGLAIDSAGNLYGTTLPMSNGCGRVFKLSRANDKWTYSTLHAFTGDQDGCDPDLAGVFVDANGNVYGTTFTGGRGFCIFGGCGVVFKITP